MFLGDNLQTMLYDLESNNIAYQLLYNMRRDKPSIGDFFDYDIGTGMLSFLPKGRAEGLQSHEGFKAAGRQQAKIGRVVRQILADKNIGFTDHDIERFADYLRALDCTLLGEFKMVTGDELLAAYLGTNYQSKQGTLNNSCMKYSDCQDYLKVYADNPETVNLLVMYNKENGKVMGRALVWQTNQGTVMDRIYGSSITQFAFETYAEDQGWWFKQDAGSWFLKKMDQQTGTYLDLWVTPENWKYDYYPYMDTFNRFNTKNGTFYSGNGHEYNVTLNGTDGDDHAGLIDAFREELEFQCEFCSNWWPRDLYDTCPECVLCPDCLNHYNTHDHDECPSCLRNRRNQLRLNGVDGFATYSIMTGMTTNIADYQYHLDRIRNQIIYQFSTR